MADETIPVPSLEPAGFAAKYYGKIKDIEDFFNKPAEKTLRNITQAGEAATIPQPYQLKDSPYQYEQPSPWFNSYLGATMGDAFKTKSPSSIFNLNQDSLSTGDFDLSKISESPITATGAQNAAQSGFSASDALQKAYSSVMDSQKNAAALGFGTLGKDKEGKQTYAPNKGGTQDLSSVGFTPEEGRRYSTERDAAGNIISITPLANPKEEPLVAQMSKGFKAAGSEGGAANPFTPNLDKFKARQDADVLAQTMIGQNPSDVAQMRQAVSNAAYDSTNRRAQRASDLASKGLSQTASGSLEQIQGQRPSSMAGITTNVLDTTNEANQALQAGRDVSSQKFNEATDLANRTNAQSQAATQMAMQGMNEQYREGQQKGAYKKPDAIAQGFYNASKEMQSQANKTALQSRNLTNQGAQSLEQGAKQYSELKAIPRTEYTQLNSAYGNVYAGKGSQPIGQAAAKKIKNKNPNQPTT